MKYTLGKKSKLKGKKNIQELFVTGTSIRKGALRTVYHTTGNVKTIQVGFTVSKRYFKKAPDRNRVKRLLREAYRLQQEQLTIPDGASVRLMMIYQSHKMPDYDYIFKLVKNSIKELNKKMLIARQH
jgi:ribonuclease P protein component